MKRTPEQRKERLRLRAEYRARKMAEMVAQYVALGWPRDEAQGAAERTYTPAFCKTMVP